jgi:hypothetical protein
VVAGADVLPRESKTREYERVHPLSWRRRVIMRRHLLERLALQVLYIGPLFWFMELLQNQIFNRAQGKWGWFYPTSDYHWFCFKSLGLWGGSIAVFWLLEVLWFQPRNIGFLRRMFIAGTIGWVGEWTAGWASYKIFGVYLQRWNDSSLQFVKVIALPFWWSNFAVFHLLSANIRDRFSQNADQPWLERGAREVPSPSSVSAVAGQTTR